MDLRLYDNNYILRAVKGRYQAEDEIKPFFTDKLVVIIIQSGMLLCYGVITIISHIPIISSCFETFTRIFSRGALGFFLRGAYYKNKLKRMGKNVFIDVGVIIWEPGNVEIDDNTFIDSYVTMMGGRKGHGYIRIGKFAEVGSNSVLAGRGGITIGDHVGIGAGSNIYSGTHLYKDPAGEDNKLLSGSILAPLDMQYVVEKPVSLNDFSWVGGRSIIMPGITIGKGAIIGGGSIVNKDVPPFCVAVGSPARVIKHRPIIS
jgi:acetyltransferase-like isoleucine patch superfamily enzyme